MKHFNFLFIFICFFSLFVSAQQDSINILKDSARKDSVQWVKNPGIVNDSLVPAGDSSDRTDSLLNFTTDSVFINTTPPVIIQDKTKPGDTRIFSGKEGLFYYIIFLFLLFGLLRMAYAKYFADLFRVFFRTTLKQKQMREQLLQAQLPSILMNCFFVLSAGLYINFLVEYFNLTENTNFWLQYLYCMSAIAFIYIVKFLGLKFMGWLFNVYEATESYIFIVFIINKMLGIMLLPFLLLLAFTSHAVFEVSLILTWIIMGLLLMYRVILSAGIARKEIQLRVFHFILYILSFEVVPVLLIYKLLMLVF